MRRICKLWAAVLALVLCLMLASCVFSPPKPNEEESTTDTTPALTTSAETTPVVTEPDFPNTPDPDGTKRY